MTRNEKFFQYINPSGRGLEVGPGPFPIAPKKEGFNVEVIDYAPKDELLSKFQAHGVETTGIEEVDHLWNGETYAELTGVKDHYDWIIASHVIEHVPDIVGFLNSCSEVLNGRGVLSLAVPDKRYCFDRFRPVSSLAQVIDSHLAGKTKHSIGSITDFELNQVLKNGLISWDRFSTGTDGYDFANQPEKVASDLRADNPTSEYTDCHAWCFTPNSFRLMINDLYELGLIDLTEIGFFPTAGNEFFIALGKNRGDAESRQSRLELAQAAERDQIEHIAATELIGTGLKNLVADFDFRIRQAGGRSQLLRKLLGRSKK
ncbi:class I SAM-dependent methyltransferase [Leptolyngbya sp. 7M]|uniref:class I SAM-dependent methyltransferase n=1 Tax=Leptolyngbya sp. 7M TaxID=2812896 RepID=UPI001B8D5FBD|nr:methyltransferase domain-containing protein [Leptolyngbya sp. 7M]QYO68238.1 class I SAM-dependent methyltransferase [Leptolyngbya sp. 7M]